MMSNQMRNELNKFNMLLNQNPVLTEGKNKFDYEWGEGVYIGGGMSFKIYFDKKLNKIVYVYPGRGFGGDVEGILPDEDIDDLINLLVSYRERKND